MRVLLDATAVSADRAGAGRYVDGLVRALGGTGVPLAVACQRADVDHYGQLAPDARVVPGPAAIAHRPARLAWEQTGLPLLAGQVEADVIHSPLYTMPLRAEQPVVVTVHDLGPLRRPELYPPTRAAFRRSAVRTAVRRADVVVVPSRATRDDAVELLGVDGEALRVVPHGVDPTLFHRPDEAERRRVRVRLGLGERPFVAYLGRLERVKNAAALVEAWVQACADRAEPPDLVLAGGAGADEDVEAALAAVPDHLRVLRPGFLRTQDLPGLLGAATLVAVPSQYEGFGLPLLEAMACGAPVLAADRAALREVGGEAVAYAPPGPDALAEELARLLDDEDRRTALSAAGTARAAGFTWQRSAEGHLGAYAAAVGR